MAIPESVRHAEQLAPVERLEGHRRAAANRAPCNVCVRLPAGGRRAMCVSDSRPGWSQAPTPKIVTESTPVNTLGKTKLPMAGVRALLVLLALLPCSIPESPAPVPLQQPSDARRPAVSLTAAAVCRRCLPLSCDRRKGRTLIEKESRSRKEPAMKLRGGTDGASSVDDGSAAADILPPARTARGDEPPPPPPPTATGSVFLQQAPKNFEGTAGLGVDTVGEVLHGIRIRQAKLVTFMIFSVARARDPRGARVAC
jgi:hypothetical protein